jgi:hypothetical protein
LRSRCSRFPQQQFSYLQQLTPQSTWVMPISLTNGLVLYLPFDGTVTDWTNRTIADLSGNGNIGNIVALTNATSTAPGKIGQGFFFDGNETTYGVSVNNNSSIAITGPITLAMD